MKIKLKKENSEGVIRVESKTIIKDVLINSEAIDMNKESIAIAFKSNNDSGFIELSKAEINFLFKKLNENKHLVKN
jgi:hypothetical protein